MNAGFLKIFPWPLYVLVAIPFLIGILVFYPRIASPYAKKHFVARWVQVFRDHPSKAELAALPQSTRPDLIFVRDFPDGSWVAARSESFHVNDMFDATVFTDSAHIIRTSYHHFCGFEGLFDELSKPAANLTEFYQHLKERKIVLHPDP